jgi:hypothetical protein
LPAASISVAAIMPEGARSGKQRGIRALLVFPQSGMIAVKPDPALLRV